jgi:hypothetical protein
MVQTPVGGGRAVVVGVPNAPAAVPGAVKDPNVKVDMGPAGDATQ